MTLMSFFLTDLFLLPSGYFPVALISCVPNIPEFDLWFDNVLPLILVVVFEWILT